VNIAPGTISVLPNNKSGMEYPIRAAASEAESGHVEELSAQK